MFPSTLLAVSILLNMGNDYMTSITDLSEKNFLETVSYEATVVSLLAKFARGTHRGNETLVLRRKSSSNIYLITVLIQSPAPSNDFLGMVSDRALLSWFSSYAERTPSFRSFLDNSLYSISLPSLHIHSSVVATISTAQVLDAMRLMSEQGVSSVAVIDEELGTLLSAVSVTDIGKVWNNCVEILHLTFGIRRSSFHAKTTRYFRHPFTSS